MNAANILVAEDNLTNLQLMTYLLQSFGYSTLSAQDGEEALTRLAGATCDLIMCDIQMPRMDGYELARHLKSDLVYASIPLVAVTALAMVGDSDKVLAAGFDGYISKPIQPKTFIQQVDRFLPAVRRSTSHHHSHAPIAAVIVSGQRQNRVLVVDHSPMNLRRMRKMLIQFGFEVDTAASVQEALQLAYQQTPDVILSDFEMPDGDGFEFLRAVKSDNLLGNVPFVFISSSMCREIEQCDALSIGADKLLVRPIDPRRLVNELKPYLAYKPEVSHG